MARYMKNSKFGRMIETDYSDQDIIEIRLSPAEYDDLCYRVRQAEEEAKEAERSANDYRETVYRNANIELDVAKKKILKNAERQIHEAFQYKKIAEQKAKKFKGRADELEKELESVKENNESMRRTKENLIRISKERANASRGITPKKTAPGYVVLSTVQHEERNPWTDQIVDAWRTQIQTPYNVHIDYDVIKDEIEADLQKQILGDLGIKEVLQKNKAGTYPIWGKKEDSKKCALYKSTFKGNYKTGYWEITMYTTHSLSVTEEYRPSSPAKAKK